MEVELHGQFDLHRKQFKKCISYTICKSLFYFKDLPYLNSWMFCNLKKYNKNNIFILFSNINIREKR